MGDEESGEAFDKVEIQKLFLKANGGSEPFSFAFGLGSRPEGCALLLHNRKSPEALKGQVKKAAPAVKKVSWGTFTVASPDVRFMPDKPVKGMVKQLRLRFREEGLAKFKPILVGPDGSEIDEETLADEDGEEGAGEVELEAEEAKADSDPKAGAESDVLKARLVALKARIEAVPKDRAAPLVQAFTHAVAQLRALDNEAAEKTVGLIETALDRILVTPNSTAEVTPQTDQAGALTRALAQIAQQIKALPPGPLQQTMAVEARRIQGMIAGSDFGGAAAALREAAATLAKSTSSMSAPKIAPLVIWREAKEAVDTGISQLQSALRGLGHPDTTRIAEFGLNGLTEGGEHTKLMAALMTFEGAAGEGKVKAAAALSAAAGAYRSFLLSNPVLPLIEANPMNVPLDIRGKLGAALDQILATAA